MKNIKSFSKFNHKISQRDNYKINDGFVPKAGLSEYVKFQIKDINLMENGRDFHITTSSNEDRRWMYSESFFYCDGGDGSFHTNLPKAHNTSVTKSTTDYLLNQIEDFCRRDDVDHESVMNGERILELNGRA